MSKHAPKDVHQSLLCRVCERGCARGVELGARLLELLSCLRRGDGSRGLLHANRLVEVLCFRLLHRLSFILLGHLLGRVAIGPIALLPHGLAILSGLRHRLPFPLLGVPVPHAAAVPRVCARLLGSVLNLGLVGVPLVQVHLDEVTVGSLAPLGGLPLWNRSLGSLISGTTPVRRLKRLGATRSALLLLLRELSLERRVPGGAVRVRPFASGHLFCRLSRGYGRGL